MAAQGWLELAARIVALSAALAVFVAQRRRRRRVALVEVLALALAGGVPGILLSEWLGWLPGGSSAPSAPRVGRASGRRGCGPAPSTASARRSTPDPLEGLDMPRTVFLLGVALFLVTVAFVATDALLWRPGVTERSVRRLRVRMTEVEAILGEPASVRLGRGGEEGAYLAWQHESGSAWIWLDADRRVTSTGWASAIPPSPLDRLRKQAGW